MPFYVRDFIMISTPNPETISEDSEGWPNVSVNPISKIDTSP